MREKCKGLIGRDFGRVKHELQHLSTTVLGPVKPRSNNVNTASRNTNTAVYLKSDVERHDILYSNAEHGVAVAPETPCLSSHVLCHNGRTKWIKRVRSTLRLRPVDAFTDWYRAEARLDLIR